MHLKKKVERALEIAIPIQVLIGSGDYKPTPMLLILAFINITLIAIETYVLLKYGEDAQNNLY